MPADDVSGEAQAAFDEIARSQGFPTFGLDSYFIFEFSPVPASAAVPEPTAAMLVLAGAVLLLARRHLRPR